MHCTKNFLDTPVKEKVYNNTMKRLFIGDLGKKFGLNPRTIRYYEASGLLSKPQRTESRYRIYTDEAIDRLEFILKAKTLGLKLSEIEEIINLHEKGKIPCACTKEFIRNKISEIDKKVAAMSELKEKLGGLLITKDYKIEKSICPIISEAEKKT